MEATLTKNNLYQQLKALGMSEEEIEDEIALLEIAKEGEKKEGDENE